MYTITYTYTDTIKIILTDYYVWGINLSMNRMRPEIFKSNQAIFKRMIAVTICLNKKKRVMKISKKPAFFFNEKKT